MRTGSAQLTKAEIIALLQRAKGAMTTDSQYPVDLVADVGDVIWKLENGAAKPEKKKKGK